MTTTLVRCTYKPDAPPVADQIGPVWFLESEDGHGDWASTQAELLELHRLYLREGVAYSVTRYPGAMTPEEADAEQFAYLRDNSLRWHPSLSAAERNA